MISHEYVLSHENRARLAPRVSSQLRALLLPYPQSLSGVALLACAYVCVKVKSLSRVRLFVTPWTVPYQAPLSMVFSRQQYWSGLPFPSPGDLPKPGIEPGSPTLQTDTLPSEPLGKFYGNTMLPMEISHPQHSSQSALIKTSSIMSFFCSKSSNGFSSHPE